MGCIHKDTWLRVLSSLRGRMSQRTFEMWFGSLAYIRHDEYRVVLGAPTQFLKDWIHDHYLYILEQAFEEVLGKALTIVWEITEEGEPHPAAETPADPAATCDHPPKRPRKTEAVRPHKPTQRLHPDFRMETFGVGKGSRMAYAAAQAVRPLGRSAAIAVCRVCGFLTCSA